MEIKPESVLPHLRIHIRIDEFLIASRGYGILKSSDSGKTWIKCGALPVPAEKFTLSKSRIISRALRIGVHQIRLIQNNKILIWCDNSIFLADRSFSDFKRIHLDTLFFQVLDNSMCVTPEFTYFGEYILNVKKNEVKIFRTRDGENWETVYSFPKNSVKHIHLLQFDPYSQKIWFSTGDEDAECLLGYANGDFSERVIVGKNSQDWRCLELIFTPEKVYWATDDPNGQNWLVSLDRKTHTLEKTARFNGPVYNLKRISSGYIILTAKEGGTGEWNNRASLWYSPDIEKFSWEECISFEKDQLPFIYGFGRIFYGTEFNNSLYLCGQALKNIDDTTLVIPSESIRTRWTELQADKKKETTEKKVIVVRGRGIDPAVNKMAFSLAHHGYDVNLFLWDRLGTVTEDPKNGFSLNRCTFRAPYDTPLAILYLPIWWIHEFIYLMKNDCALIHACDIDTIVPAVLVKMIKNVPLVYTIYDFYADCLPARTPVYLRKIIAFFDKTLIRFTNTLILVDESRYAQVKGAKINTLAYICNTPPDNYVVTPDQDKVSGRNDFILFYAGALLQERGLNFVLEAVKDTPHIQVILAGFGPELEMIREYMKSDPEKVHYLGLISYDEVIDKTVKADILFAFYDPSIPNNRYASPNKMFEAMMCRKPVITNEGTSMADIVLNENCGLVVPYGDTMAIKQAILTLRDNPELCRQLGANGRKAYDQKYSWAIMEKRLLAVYETLIP